MAEYLFDNQNPVSETRFSSLSSVYDPWTIWQLDRLSLPLNGMRALEIGAGNGSLAHWLSARAGESGSVQLTEINTSKMDVEAIRRLGNVTVAVHDIGLDPLGEGCFDLIHARLVLGHIPTRVNVLDSLVTVLAPGGWLVIEDYALRSIERKFPISNDTDKDIYQKASAVIGLLLQERGSDPAWAPSLYRRFRELGLQNVQLEGRLSVWSGASDGLMLDRANLDQVFPEAQERGLLTRNEYDACVTLLEDPEFAVCSPVLFTAMGQKRHPPSERQNQDNTQGGRE